MAWTAPMTAVANSVFTAAQFNTHLRDNLNSTAPAKAANTGGYFVVSGVNEIVERVAEEASVETAETTTSTSYTDLATVGPSVTLETGSSALVLVGARVGNDTASQNGYASFAVSGDSTIAGADNMAVIHQSSGVNEVIGASRHRLVTGLTPGTNTFTMKYRVTGGTGSFANRHISVVSF